MKHATEARYGDECLKERVDRNIPSSRVWWRLNQETIEHTGGFIELLLDDSLRSCHKRGLDGPTSSTQLVDRVVCLRECDGRRIWLLTAACDDRQAQMNARLLRMSCKRPTESLFCLLRTGGAHEREATAVERGD